MQQTLKETIGISGIGLHTGMAVTMVLAPAPADQGIVFVRSDLSGDNRIPALWDRVCDSQLCTVIANEAGASVGTIEHLMAALRGCGIDNATVELDGPEVPALDGSAMPFVEVIDETGIQTQDAPRRAIRVLRTVSVARDGKRATLHPAAESLFSGSIDFDHPKIGHQRLETRLLNGNFRHDLAEARTFGFIEQVEALQNGGLALGASFQNAIVLSRDAVLNPEGLRVPDEFIRHKLLDAVGDLYLAGAPILGAYEGVRAGHALNNAVLHALFADPQTWEYIELPEENSAPGSASMLRTSEARNLISA